MGWSGRAPAPPASEACRGINDKEHAMSQKFREGPWPKTGTESAKLNRIHKTPLGDVKLKPWPRIFEARIGLNLHPLARAKLRVLRAQPHPRQLSRGRCTRQHIDQPQPPVLVFCLRGFLRSETSGHPSPCP